MANSSALSHGVGGEGRPICSLQAHPDSAHKKQEARQKEKQNGEAQVRYLPVSSLHTLNQKEPEWVRDSDLDY